jgi:signal transduction histidine kinase
MSFRVRGSRLWLDSDQKLLRRVLQNFLTNAFRYASGRVLLGVRREGQRLRLEVWDRGPGIPDDIRERMFYPLVSGREGGSGLGLTIAQNFIQHHHGTIDCASRPGSTVFTLRLPIEQA